MKLVLVRDRQTRQGTTGHLFPDAHGGAASGAPFCVTLERPAACYDDPHPCIPAGEYGVAIYESPHFGRLMPLIEHVPNRAGIEIHWGNFVRDFESCIGVGASRGQMPDGSPTIWNSRATFDRLFAAIEAAFARRGDAQPESCTIAIRDPQSAAQFDAPMFAGEREVSAPGV